MFGLVAQGRELFQASQAACSYRKLFSQFAPMISAQIAAESEGEFAIVGTSKQLQEVLVN